VNLPALLSAFGFIFLLELPDKTAYTVLILSTRHRALPVLLGSMAAFAVQSALAVLLGTLLHRLPAPLVEWGAIALMAGFGLLLLLGRDEEVASPPMPDGRVFLTSFGLVFVAELGDATQFATAAQELLGDAVAGTIFLVLAVYVALSKL
jgi:putative Ca2+/H+ antiporter (TMEM165/GDT1 family)